MNYYKTLFIKIKNNYSDYSYSIIARFIESIGNITLSLILARLFKPEGFGEFAYLYSMILFLVYWVDFGRGELLIQRSSRFSEEKSLTLLRDEFTQYVYAIIVYSIPFLLLLIFIISVKDFFDPAILLVAVLMGVSEVIRRIAAYWKEAMKSIGNWREVPILELFNYPLLIIFATFGLVNIGGLVGLSAGMIMSRIVYLIITLVRTNQYKLFALLAIDYSKIIFLTKLGISFGLFGFLSYYGINALIPIIVYNILGPEAAGFIQATNKILMGMGLLTIPLIDVIFQRFVKLHQKDPVQLNENYYLLNNRKYVNDIYRYLTIFTAIITFIFILLSDRIVYILLGNNYSEIVPVLLITSPSIYFRCLYSLLNKQMLARGSFKSVKIANLYFFVLFITFVFVGSKYYPQGIVGAGYGVLCANAIGFIISYYYFRKDNEACLFFSNKLMTGIITVLVAIIIIIKMEYIGFCSIF
jgi:O-antigen/teichoic acid export membrane protein